jgi:hypothetical protein
MRFFIVVLISIFCYPTGFSQQRIIPELKNICPISLGTLVKNVQDTFICNDARHTKSTAAIIPQCQLYRYLPSKSNSYNLGGLTFDKISVLVDSNDAVKSIDYSKWYKSTDSLENSHQIDKDCDEVIDFLRTYFHKKGTKGKTYSSDYLNMESYTWKREHYNLTVQKEKFRKNKSNGNAVLVIVVDK